MLYLAIGYALGPAGLGRDGARPAALLRQPRADRRSRAADLAVRSRTEARRAVAGQAVVAAAAPRLSVDGADRAVPRARSACSCSACRRAPRCSWPQSLRPPTPCWRRTCRWRIRPIATACASASRRRADSTTARRFRSSCSASECSASTISAAAAGAGWRSTSLWAIAGGLAIGGALGALIGKLVVYLRTQHKEAVGLDEFLALGLIAIAYGVAQLSLASGFLAVFAAGLALQRIEAHSRRAQPSTATKAKLILGAESEKELATHARARGYVHDESRAKVSTVSSSGSPSSSW